LKRYIGGKNCGSISTPITGCSAVVTLRRPTNRHALRIVAAPIPLPADSDHKCRHPRATSHIRSPA
jgi:hypothetical protein